MTEPLSRVYLEPVRARLARFRRLRTDLQKLDWVLAGLLTLGLELEVWLGSGGANERLATALLGPTVTGALAVRRRFKAAGDRRLKLARVPFRPPPSSARRSASRDSAEHETRAN